MNKIKSTIVSSVFVVAAVAGCKQKDDDKAGPEAKKPGPAAATKVAAPAKAKTTCADWGMTGKGDFGDSCKSKQAPPFVMTWKGTWTTDDRGEETPAFEIKSTFDHDVDWGTVSLWYYDASGQPLEITGQDGSKFRHYYSSGGGVLEIKAGETKEMHLGMTKAATPAGVVAIEAQVESWGWDRAEPKMFFQRDDYASDYNPEMRPRAGK